ncbi:MAG: hypothetical protein ACYCST_21695, partial [Acidimicrobiales bacterium]
YPPERSGVQFDHHPLTHGEVVWLGNAEIQAYLVTDRQRAEQQAAIVAASRAGGPLAEVA